jgi:hypothetical protein
MRIEQSFDRRRPPERAERHLRRPLLDRRNDVGRVLRRGRKTGVLETVDADRERAADFLGPVRVRDDRPRLLTFRPLGP